MKTLPLALCAAALLGGIVALLVWGASPPVWLAALEAALLMGAALIYGYFGHVPAVPRWVWLRPVRGAVLVVLGIVAMYVPPQLVLAAFLVGMGVRLVWQSACDLDRRDALPRGSESQGARILEPHGLPPGSGACAAWPVAARSDEPRELPSPSAQPMPLVVRPAVAVTAGTRRRQQNMEVKPS